MWILGGIAFALTPWLTLGFATPIVFLAAALAFGYLGRATALLLWGATVGYLVALVVEIVTVDAASGSSGAVAWTACVIITTPVAGIHAVAFSVWVAAHRYRPERPAADGACVQAPLLSLHLGSRVVALAFSADSRLLSVGGRRRAGIYDLKAACVADRGARSAAAGWVSTLVLSRDGRCYAQAVGLHGQVAIYDLVTRAERVLDCRAPARRSRVTAMAFSPDATRLVTATGCGLVTIRDLLTGTPALTVRHGKPHGYRRVTMVSYSPDGRLLATGGSDGMIHVWDSRTGAPYLTIQHPDSPAVVHEYGGRTPPPIRTLAFSPDGTRLAAGSHETVALWPIAAEPGKPTFRSRPSRAGRGPAAIAFSPDSTQLAAAHAHGTAKLWDLRTGEPAAALRHTSGWTRRLTAVTFSPDGTLLAAGASDGTVRLWQLT
jgi:WD40 repeat protein